MKCITDRENIVIAYLHNMMIIDLMQKKVIGLVIGNCVFGKGKDPIGKILNNTFLHFSGEKLALLKEETHTPDSIKLQEKDFIIEAWIILKNVQNHTCIWIEEKNNWHENDLLCLLQQEK